MAKQKQNASSELKYLWFILLSKKSNVTKSKINKQRMYLVTWATANKRVGDRKNHPHICSQTNLNLSEFFLLLFSFIHANSMHKNKKIFLHIHSSLYFCLERLLFGMSTNYFIRNYQRSFRFIQFQFSRNVFQSNEKK